MPTVIQFRRGTTSQNNSFTGTLGELTVDTTLNQLRIHDGSTAGGDTIGGSSSAMVLIDTEVASDSASITLTGLDSSTYESYMIVGSQLHPATDTAQPWLRLGDSGGIDSGASDYKWRVISMVSASAAYDSDINLSDAQIVIGTLANSTGVGFASGEGLGFVGFINSGVASSGVYTMMHGQSVEMARDTADLMGVVWWGNRIAILDLTQVQFLFHSGNIVSGRFSIYGVAHA